MGSRPFVFEEKLILPFRKHIKDKICWRILSEWCKLFLVANKDTVSPCPRRACLHAYQVSVSSIISRHEGPFWSVLFQLSAISSKFSNEVLHVKFDFQYFVTEMFRWKEIWHRKSTVPMEVIVGVVVEQIDILSWKVPRSFIEWNLVPSKPLDITGNWMYLHWFFFVVINVST